MLTKTEILLFLKKNKAYLHDQFGVAQIGIFGSFARDEADEKSDIDFLVEIDAPIEVYKETKEALHNYLKNAFGREVDMANPRSLKPHYRARILKQALYA
jgi:predicted nucleotidyltransferase